MNPNIHPVVERSTHIRVLDEWQALVPEDLYIPPSAFEILLEHFEGPLDFLIYLIQKNGFDLLQLDIAPIASQYLAYMHAMKSLNIELTADYMVMAALLADLKSRLLLPKPNNMALEKDPKHNLIDRLENYLRIKNAAEELKKFQILERDTFPAHVQLGTVASLSPEGYDAMTLQHAMLCIFQRPEPVIHHVPQEPVLLEERIAFIQQQIASGNILSFEQLLSPHQGKIGLVVTFMAVLELTRQQKINSVSTGFDAPLTIQGVAQ